jgi:hypothetical protein
VLSLLVLYFLAEVFVWIPATLALYCPKQDWLSDSSMDKLRPFGDAQSLLILQNSESEPEDLSLRAIGTLSDSLTEVSIPASQIPPGDQFQYLAEAARDATFVVFQSLPESDPRCSDAAELIAEMQTTMLPGYRTLIEDHVSKLRQQKKCLAISFSDAINADFLDMTTDTIIVTSAGRIKIRESLDVPLRSSLGQPARSKDGALYPTLPITGFFVRLFTNGYIEC